MVKKILLGATIALFVLSAQQPTCNKCSASYISSGEVESYLTRAKDNGLVDQQTRAVNIGKANIGIGAVYRGKLDAPMPDSVAEHDLVHILDRQSLAVLTSFGEGGRQPGEFYGVHSIATDSKGNIYTTETYRGQRVQKFVYKGLAAVTKEYQGVVWPKK